VDDADLGEYEDSLGADLAEDGVLQLLQVRRELFEIRELLASA
jgi:hypothetical protein